MVYKFILFRWKGKIYFWKSQKVANYIVRLQRICQIDQKFSIAVWFRRWELLFCAPYRRPKNPMLKISKLHVKILYFGSCGAIFRVYLFEEKEPLQINFVFFSTCKLTASVLSFLY